VALSEGHYGKNGSYRIPLFGSGIGSEFLFSVRTREYWFTVTLDKSHSSMPRAVPGKAVVIFIQDFGAQKFGIGVHVIGRIGVDGAWVGAIKDNSYHSAFLEAGEHHICVNLDSELLGNPVEFAHFTAEAGKVYYFRSRYMSGGTLLLAPVDSDEANYLLAMFPLSLSKPKK
jgi:hypothetical protein